MMKHVRTTHNVTTDRQKAMTYILYMFMGSYFHKCDCKSPVLARSLLLYYKEMPVGKQLHTEKSVMKAIDKVLRKEGMDPSDLNSEVTITLRGNNYLIRFQTWFENIVITVKSSGDYDIRIQKEESPNAVW